MEDLLREFKRTVKSFARKSRRDFPWRNTNRPYRILVSEIMLQQTQTDRVIGYYHAFLKKFPTIKALAEAPLAEVIAAWQGLGYNRRARFLWQLARVVTEEHRGKLPKDPELLLSLPGVGRYTAHAVCVFAYNQPLAMIETNIRTVFIVHFFRGKRGAIHDRDLMPLIERTIDRRNPREWFYALMDYGNYLKKQHKQINKRSVHYARQAAFEGSRRQLRGFILKHLVAHGSISIRDMRSYGSFSEEEKAHTLEQLCRESLIIRSGAHYRLPQR